MGMFDDVEGIVKRQMVLFFVVDTSGSMQGTKIGAVNTAIREVLEETGAKAQIMKYIGASRYSFLVPEGEVRKEVHWYLMMADSYYSRPQKEEYFVDSGFYKYHEAYHLLRFPNEKQILEKAYREYNELKRNGQLL